MASTACSECSRTFETSRDSYPFCSWDCHHEDARRRARRESTDGSTPPPTRRPGRVRGF